MHNNDAAVSYHHPVQFQRRRPHIYRDQILIARKTSYLFCQDVSPNNGGFSVIIACDQRHTNRIIILSANYSCVHWFTGYHAISYRLYANLYFISAKCWNNLTCLVIFQWASEKNATTRGRRCQHQRTLNVSIVFVGWVFDNSLQSQ